MDRRLSLRELLDKQNELLGALEQGTRKDFWDKLSLSGGVVAGIAIAVIGGAFTYSYQQAQLRIEELKAAETLTEALASADMTKRDAAIAALIGLGSARTISQVAQLYPTEKTIAALADLLRNGDRNEAKTAELGLGRILLDACARADVTLIDEILASGMDPDLIRDARGRTALAILAWKAVPGIMRISEFDLMLKRGADPNSQDDEGRTPLVWAALNDHEESNVFFNLMEPLLDAGARIDIADEHGDTVLHVVTSVGRSLITRQLSGRLDSDELWLRKNKLGTTPISNCLNMKQSLKRMRIGGEPCPETVYLMGEGTAD
jgi:hypothetical protein